MVDGVAAAHGPAEGAQPLLKHGFVWLLATFSSSGGLYQGYAIGLLNGLSTSSTFEEAFPDLLPASDQQATPAFVFVFVLGAAAGALPPIAGLAAGLLGRKKAIVLGALIGAVSGVLMAATPAGDVVWLYCTRFVSGIAVGILSVLIPLYQSEVAPVQLRGRLMATFQLAVTLGILCAVLTDYVLSQLPNGADCERYALCHQRWRLVLALQILPCLVLAAGMPLLPESPRWLMMKSGGEAAARRALMHIRKSADLNVLQELHEMRTYCRDGQPEHARNASPQRPSHHQLPPPHVGTPAGGYDPSEGGARRSQPTGAVANEAPTTPEPSARAEARRNASELAVRISGLCTPEHVSSAAAASWIIIICNHE